MRLPWHNVYSRSLSDWVLKHDTDYYVQRDPAVLAAIPTIPQEQLDYREGRETSAKERRPQCLCRNGGRPPAQDSRRLSCCRV